MRNFDDVWREVVKRSEAACIPVVQDYDEMKYVYGLVTGCKSYLEVGTAEGNGLYILSHSLEPDADITYIDFGEKHTTKHRNWVLDKIGRPVVAIHGDSNDYSTLRQVLNKKFEAVFIDAGHDDFNVAIDALFYGPLATKYIIFHDVQLPDVSRVFDWYCKQRPEAKNYRVVNSQTYGYGIIEL